MGNTLKNTLKERGGSIASGFSNHMKESARAYVRSQVDDQASTSMGANALKSRKKKHKKRHHGNRKRTGTMKARASSRSYRIKRRHHRRNKE